MASILIGRAKFFFKELSPSENGQLLYLTSFTSSYESLSLSKHSLIFPISEHEISNAHIYKKKKYHKIQLFSGSDKPRMLFFLLINVEMPRLLTF